MGPVRCQVYNQEHIPMLSYFAAPDNNNFQFLQNNSRQIQSNYSLAYTYNHLILKSIALLDGLTQRAPADIFFISLSRSA